MCQNFHLFWITVSKKYTNKQTNKNIKKINKSFPKQHMQLLLSLSLINVMFLHRLLSLVPKLKHIPCLCIIIKCSGSGIGIDISHIVIPCIQLTNTFGTSIDSHFACHPPLSIWRGIMRHWSTFSYTNSCWRVVSDVEDQERR